MSLRIAGMGWVTPLGSEIPEVWARLLAGEVATSETISSPLQPRTFQAFRVPAPALAKMPAHPRLRRSSAISKFAVTAGLAALDDANFKIDPAKAERTAIIFAISNGGVIYTKRFYHDVVESGAPAASPLLFPETVFNAPASHLAAILGITGASYTLVGDGAVGLLAMKMAEDLLQNPALDRCLVVGAEEADWLLCDAYHRWRLLRGAGPLEVFKPRPRGTILSEGAGAVLLGRSDRTGPAICATQIEPGCNFRTQREAPACVDKIFDRLQASNDDLIVCSANGTFVDRAEQSAIERRCPQAQIYAPKQSLGESVGAASLWQIICAAQTLSTGKIPGEGERPNSQIRRAIVSVCGLNQQVAGLSISRHD